MQWKKYCQYQMDFKSKWTQASAALMGVSFFARMVYYFGIRNIVDCGFFEVVLSMVLPLVLCGGYLVMMSALKRDVAGVYGLIGGALCALLTLESIFTLDIIRILLALVFYAAAGGALVATIAGYLPGRLLSSAMMLIVFAGRLLIYSLRLGSILQWVLEISVLLMLLSLFCLSRSTKTAPFKQKNA